MTILKFLCENRDYTIWDLYDENTSHKVDRTHYDFDPVKCKVFNHDIIEFDEQRRFKTIVQSCKRDLKTIPGILTFDKMYGKTKNDKYYLKVRPNDPRLPAFLVPYKAKKSAFSKKMNNKYIIFRYNNWNGKHPIGEIVHTIGDIKDLPNFYEYQLYCKNLYTSIKHFTNETKHNLQKYSNDELIHNMIQSETFVKEDRRDWDIITIDPENSKDFDDAFGIKKLNRDDNMYQLSIYIANVSIWLDFLDLWGSFSQRVSTIYLPDRKRPMLPTILSDMFCSLQQDETRFAFTCDIIIHNNVVIDYSFKNCVIKVRKNYRYNDASIEDDDLYSLVFDTLKNLVDKRKYMRSNNLTETKHVVSFLMTMMNYFTAKKLMEHKNGIFRSININHGTKTYENVVPSEVAQFLVIWNSKGGQYVTFNDFKGHDLLKLDTYVHITSPIRRIVDLLNSIIIQNDLGLVNISKHAQTFLDKWLSKEMIEYINVRMRSIRKLQTQCDTLNKCVNNPHIMEKTYKGYVFDKIKRSDTLFQYMVYIPEVKMLNKYTTRLDHDNYSSHNYKMYLFEDSETFKKKILFHLIE